MLPSTSDLNANNACFKTLLERFANSTSMDDIFDSLETIYKDADKDPEPKGWFKNVNTFIRKCLQEQGFIMEEACNREWNSLYDHGRYLLRDRYKAHTNRVLDEIKFFGEQYNEDPHNKAFGNSMDKLFTDLGKNAEGKQEFKKHLLKDIGNVILPGIFEHVRYVPLPRIEVSDPAVDVVVENLVLESDNLMPNVMEFGSDNYFRWGRKKITNKRDNKIMISMGGIQADLRDVSYYIKKKQGFPSITDKGVMDIILGGEGFSFKIAASTANKGDKQHLVKLDKVSVNIKNMDIKLKKSSHKILFNTFKPMLNRVVRPALQKVIESQIRSAFENGDAFANDIHTEAKRAQEAAREDPENAPSIFSRYADAMRARSQAKAKEAEGAVKRDTKVQTVMTLHDSLFPDVKLPGGISTKATEYAELAGKGERWESPIFSIGSASESSDLPVQTPVTRKAHTTADGTAGTNGSSKATKSFSNEVDQAFVNDKTQNLGDGIKAGANGTTNVANGSTSVA